MATHSSVLAWRIPGIGEPGGLPSMGSHRVGHDSAAAAAAATHSALGCCLNSLLIYSSTIAECMQLSLEVIFIVELSRAVTTFSYPNCTKHQKLLGQLIVFPSMHFYQDSSYMSRGLVPGAYIHTTARILSSSCPVILRVVK